MSALEKYAVCLTSGKQKHIDGAFGRKKEIAKLTQIMLRKTKSNAILVGKAGVGKTAIVEQLAKEIKDKSIHYALHDYSIYELNINSLIGGSRERGELESRVKELLEDLSKIENAVLMIDEIHNIVKNVKSEKSNTINLSQILKPALARGSLKCIGATTFDEYKILSQDKAFERRFVPIMVDEPNIIETREILESLKNVYQKYHKCFYDKEALDACVDISNKYIHYRNFPDKAIDLMDEVGSFNSIKNVNMNEFDKRTTITKQHVLEFVSTYLKIPIESITQSSLNKIEKLEMFMKSSIIGQDTAIDSLCRTLMRKECGLYAEKKPIASFLFYGQSACGKTSLAKIIGNHYYKSLKILDMSEYMETFSLSKLIGSPPGYVGYEEGGGLTNFVKKNPYSVIIFDEIEKAHPKIFNILLQILEDGRLTDNMGNTIRFNNCIIILTSNAASEPKKTIGFIDDPIQDGDHNDLKEYFNPEFLNRFDNIIKFNPITKENIEIITRSLMNEKITDIKMKGYNKYIEELNLEDIYDKVVEHSNNPREVRKYVDLFLVDSIVEKVL
jgi:ATP-dependent Clp protease ATP-binding subunit ClpA